ncbi:glutamine--scyllo-inositol aminotransferase [Marivirga tractuosa]|uniref:DegT/DnrJ/EryC1/StrS aminotransferase n=1 Tax=Marivirga tractuosa (strain ATCC 23168 / DSM 4126 / NBRC 15989 / NCIMB 1408 / VKM B-1430 / H-43) TaxID=643867 RepID=E4TT52_MARTH|nr:DegT/DnrJ/EryC1/StrS family aminotransferase [Marivirga tractuosa]ADR20900.1 DegT/DnrJ/EryC1/StrS aminotransferase [Marivirga tractuosa DSM 4126]BDD14649.1 glutamine--scyllo-inositol aminotransferase [Marivirga tractuosa]
MQFDSVPFLRLSPLRAEVKTALEDVLENGVFMNGENIEAFKYGFSNFLDLNAIIPTANCTDALEIILRSLDIQEGDEVITSAFSWFSDASVIKLIGAKVVFCDIDISHFEINLSDLERRITVKTKALILPHLFGLLHPEIDKISSICKQNNIVLIEDCAQAHGASLNGKLAGTFGDVAVFSFYPTKNLAALGDAGAIATNNGTLAENCSRWANHGQEIRNEHLQLGRNSRMDEIQAAVLCTNLTFLHSDNEKRQKLAGIYYDILADTNCALPHRANGHVYHQFVIRTDRRDELQKFLLENNIETDIHYPTALSDMEVFYSLEKFDQASLASRTVLSLPIHPNHTELEISFVAEKIKSFFRA